MQKANINKEWEEIKEIPFPKNSKFREIEDLRIELIEYDGFLAGQIDSVLTKNSKSYEKIITNPEIENKLDELYGKYKDKDPIIANMFEYYNKYKSLIKLINATRKKT
jgi:hypothetical protein